MTSTGETIVSNEKPATMPADNVVYNVPSHQGPFEEGDDSSEDEGLTFGRPRKRSTTKPMKDMTQ